MRVWQSSTLPGKNYHYELQRDFHRGHLNSLHGQVYFAV